MPIFGYLLGKAKELPVDNTTQLTELERRNTKLQAELKACKDALESDATAATKENVPKATSLTTENQEKTFDSAAAKAAMGKSVKQDRFKDCGRHWS